MNIKLIDIPIIEDAFGDLAVVEKNIIPFEIKRVFYTYNIPSIAKRGGHGHKKLKEVLIAISGSFDVVLRDGFTTQTIQLNKPNQGLLLNENIWNDLINFSDGAVCLVLASDVYDESDYIRDYDEFENYVKKLND